MASQVRRWRVGATPTGCVTDEDSVQSQARGGHPALPGHDEHCRAPSHGSGRCDGSDGSRHITDTADAAAGAAPAARDKPCSGSSTFYTLSGGRFAMSSLSTIPRALPAATAPCAACTVRRAVRGACPPMGTSSHPAARSAAYRPGGPLSREQASDGLRHRRGAAKAMPRDAFEELGAPDEWQQTHNRHSRCRSGSSTCCPRPAKGAPQQARRRI